MEQEGVLLDERDRSVPALRGELPVVDAVHRDAPRRRRAQPQQQRGERRLARAGAADDRDGLSGADLEGHVAQRLGPGPVGVAEPLQPERRPEAGKLDRAERPLGIHRRVQEALHFADAAGDVEQAALHAVSVFSSGSRRSSTKP